MRIKIRTEEHRLSLPIPNFLLTGSLTRRILLHELEKSGAQLRITEEQFRALARSLREIRRSHGRLQLVEVRTAKGEQVSIWL